MEKLLTTKVNFPGKEKHESQGTSKYYSNWFQQWKRLVQEWINQNEGESKWSLQLLESYAISEYQKNPLSYFNRKLSGKLG